MKKEFVYEAPKVEVIEVAVEKGYANSDPYRIEVANEDAMQQTDADGHTWWCL